METPKYVQYRAVASAEEAELIERIVKAKDEIVKLTPGFAAEAEELRRKLRPHDAEIYLRASEASKEELAEADKNNAHNIQAARPFARKWYLPFLPALNIDPSYLIDRPFSGAPYIDGSAFAVTEVGSPHLPVLALEIDIRFPKELIKDRIDDRIDAARKEWKSKKGMFMVDPKRELAKIESMVRIAKARPPVDKGRRRKGPATQLRVARTLAKKTRQVQRLEEQLQQLLAKKEYWKIAPYTHLEWARQRDVAIGRVELERAKGWPIRKSVF